MTKEELRDNAEYRELVEKYGVEDMASLTNYWLREHDPLWGDNHRMTKMEYPYLRGVQVEVRKGMEMELVELD